MKTTWQFLSLMLIASPSVIRADSWTFMVKGSTQVIISSSEIPSNLIAIKTNTSQQPSATFSIPMDKHITIKIGPVTRVLSVDVVSHPEKFLIAYRNVKLPLGSVALFNTFPIKKGLNYMTYGPSFDGPFVKEVKPTLIKKLGEGGPVVN